MKKLLFIPLFLFMISPFLIHNQAEAQSRTYDEGESAIGIGPRLGYYTSEDADDGNFYGGLQLRARTGPVFGLEVAVDYRTEQTFEVEGYSAAVRSVPVTASAMLFIPTGEAGFAPYGIAGLGAYYTIYDYSNEAEDLGIDDTNNFNLGYHLGGGVEIPFSANVALNIDYRYLFLNPDENEENLDDSSFSGNVFTAGLTFYL